MTGRLFDDPPPGAKSERTFELAGEPHRRIRNQALYQDRTVQDWHSDALPKSFAAIDLDLAGVCNSCWRTLYLIESTTNPDKTTTILRNLAEDAGVPAILVRHDRRTIVRTYGIWPAAGILGDGPEVTEAWIRRHREHHVCRFSASLAVADGSARHGHQDGVSSAQNRRERPK